MYIIYEGETETETEERPITFTYVTFQIRHTFYFKDDDKQGSEKVSTFCKITTHVRPADLKPALSPCIGISQSWLGTILGQ